MMAHKVESTLNGFHNAKCQDGYMSDGLKYEPENTSFYYNQTKFVPKYHE